MDFYTFINAFSELFTRSNITFAIAVFGFLLSLYNFFHEKLQNRMELNVTYKNHFISEHDNMGITMSLSFENLVANQISISRIFLSINDEKYDFYWIPKFVYRSALQTNGKVFDEINIHTIPLPFQIDGYGVVGGFFFVKVPYHITNEILLNSDTSLVVHSNKGIKSYNITMSNPDHED